MKRQSLLLVVLLLALGAVLWWQLRPRRPSSVLLVVIDTLRADALGSYRMLEPGPARSPVLDGLAAEGLRFEAAYAPATWTLPSVTSYLTGLMPGTHGMTSWMAGRLPEHLPYLPEVLQQQGLTTVGLMGNANIGNHNGFERGFDLWLEGRTDARLHVAGLPLYPAAEDLTDVALEALRRIAGQPFLLYVHYMDPHGPYLLPEGAPDHFADPDYEGYVVTEMEEVREVMGQRYTRVYPYFWSKFRDNEADRQRVRDLYASKVRYVDEQMGRLLSELETLGLADDTLVVVLSDHGEGLSEHGIREHEADPYEHQVRVPLIVRGPGIRPGRIESGLTEIVDLPQVITERLGLQWPGQTEGNGVFGLSVAGEEPPEDAFAVSQSYLASDHREVRSIRRGEDKLLVGEGVQLRFDLDADPAELADQFDDAGGLEAELAELLESRLGAVRLPGTNTEEVDAEQLERLRALGYAQ